MKTKVLLVFLALLSGVGCGKVGKKQTDKAPRTKDEPTSSLTEPNLNSGEQPDKPKLSPDAKRIYQDRKRLDETVWKEETQAQVYEETFVGLWDALRAAKDKWEPFEKFPLDSIALAAEGKTTKHDWGIHATHYVGGKEKLDSKGWQTWLAGLRAQGLEIVETEWHHEEFNMQGDRPGSVFKFVLHAIGPKSMRYIVRGKLRVAWTDVKDTAGHFEPGHIDVLQAVIYRRQGKAPFTELMRLSPKDANPPGMPGPNGSAPLTMPLLVYDLNRDGRSEMVLAGANLVYWNDGGGRFGPAALCRFYPARLQAAVIADFDNDGMADLLGIPEASPPVLYRGGKARGFDQQPEVIKVSPQVIYAGSCITAGDIDGDGDLDAWLTTNKAPYLGGQMPTPYYDSNDGYPSFLLVNDGNGHFTDKTKEAGLDKKRNRRTYSSSFVDLDVDEDLDLVVINDFAGLDVYLNDGKGHFTDVTERLGEDRFSFGMSHALADFNADGALDLYMVGMGSTTARRLEGMKLGRKEFPAHQKARMPMAYGNRLFLGGKNLLKQAPYNDLLARTGWAWGCTAQDFDNDGDLDLYITNGNISGKSAKDHCTTFWRHDIYAGTSDENPALDGLFSNSLAQLKDISWNGFEHNVLLMNESRGSFINVSFLVNAAQEYDSRALVGEDLDGDGRMDILMIEKVFEEGRDKADYLRVLYNAWDKPGNWVGVRLHENGRGYSPVGARITVLAGGRRQILPVVTGDSHRSQHSNQKHFGLGTVDKIDAIEVRWPNGKVSRLEEPAVNQYHEVKPE